MSKNESSRDEKDTSSISSTGVLIEDTGKKTKRIPYSFSVDDSRRRSYYDTDEAVRKSYISIEDTRGWGELTSDAPDYTKRHWDSDDLGHDGILGSRSKTGEIASVTDQGCEIGDARPVSSTIHSV